MSWTVIEIDGSGRVTVRSGGTLTGKTEPETMPEPSPEPEPKPKLVVWRLCVRIEPDEIDDQWLHTGWFRSEAIPEHWYPVESCTQPIETVKQLPEREMP